MKITFIGAVGTVTGSKTLVTEGDTRILVDCGLYQGVKQVRLRNRQPLHCLAGCSERRREHPGLVRRHGKNLR